MSIGAFAGLTWVGSEARADPHPAIGRSRQTGAPEKKPDAPLPPEQQRVAPDYDGRADPPPTASEVALWVPRVVLYPVYWVTEYVIRRPLGAAVSAAEQNDLQALALDVFTFGTEQNVGIVPTALIDFGFRPSVGLYYFYNDFIVDENDLRAQAAWGGSDWVSARITDRVYPGKDQELGTRALFSKRPDWIFHGLGPRSREASLGRFSATSFVFELFHEARLWRESALGASAGVRSVRFDESRHCCEDVSVATQLARGVYPAPPGLEAGYDVAKVSANVALDTRPLRQIQEHIDGSDFTSPAGGGLRLAARGTYAQGLNERVAFEGDAPQRYQWVSYGASLGGFVDMTDLQRVVGLSLAADFADPVGAATQIPFVEQVSLGGDRPMRGFLEGRLVDRSSLAARFEYRWPVWVWLDGTIQYDVGNVFGEHLRDFSFEDLRSSFAIGMRGNGSHDHTFELLLAIGTQTFAQGHSVDNVRFVLGASNGF
jgi:hypothetical protein